MFANLKIARKLLVAFATTFVAFVAVAVFIVISLANVDRATARVRDSEIASGAARALWGSFITEQNAVRGFVISQSDKFLADIQAVHAVFLADIGRFRAAEKDPTILERMAVVEKLVRDWRAKSAEKQVALASDPATRAEASTYVNGQFATKIQAGLNEITSIEAAVAAKYGTLQDRASATVNWALAAAGLTMAVLAGGLLWLLTRSIAVPVALITNAMDRLAQGDTGVTIPALGRRDEIGRIAASLQVFSNAAVQQRRVEQAAADARLEADAARDVNERERAQAAAVQGEVIAKLGAGLARLSDGDLTARMEQALALEYETVRSDFNQALRELHSAMQAILTSTAGLRSGTHEITQAADDLARRTEQQAASLEQTAAALGEITTAVRKTAEGAEQARDTVAETRSDAERSGNVVQDAVAAMGEIEQSAKQISQIIGVIDEIAFQTNLLALNAGVEAARAGDAGRGFAVVASEVRALAQRSAEAAKEIKALISTSTQLVGRGVGLVGETGKSLSRIVGQVTAINAIVAEIATSAKEQATGLAEVNAAVNQMDQVTQQNAAMVEQSTAASHALAEEAQELARLTSRFRLEAAPAGSGGVEELSPLRQRSVGKPPSRSPSAIYPVRGATALAPRTAPIGQTEWEEV